MCVRSGLDNEDRARLEEKRQLCTLQQERYDDDGDGDKVKAWKWKKGKKTVT